MAFTSDALAGPRMLSLLGFLAPLVFPTAAWAIPTEVAFGPRQLYRSVAKGDGQLQVAITEATTSVQNTAPTWSLRVQPTTISRPTNPEVYQEARLRSMRHAQEMPVEWEDVTVLAPDVQNQHTLSQLARMTGNAYALPGRKNWYDIDPAWNTVSPIYSIYSRYLIS